MSSQAALKTVDPGPEGHDEYATRIHCASPDCAAKRQNPNLGAPTQRAGRAHRYPCAAPGGGYAV